MPNDHWMYLFIRQDIPTEHQITQSNHATYALALAYNPTCEVPNIVTIGVPDLAALERVRYKLVQNQIPHYAWEEPDLDLGFTSITTVPLDYEQKQVLKNYRVYRGGDTKVSCRVNPDAPTSSPGLTANPASSGESLSSMKTGEPSRNADACC